MKWPPYGPVTPEKVRERRAELMRDLKAARHRTEDAQNQIRHLIDLCPHPSVRRITHMGDPCWHCPDCDGCDVRRSVGEERTQ